VSRKTTKKKKPAAASRARKGERLLITCASIVPTYVMEDLAQTLHGAFFTGPDGGYFQAVAVRIDEKARKILGGARKCTRQHRICSRQFHEERKRMARGRKHSKRTIYSLGQSLRWFPDRKVKPTEAFAFLFGRQEWLTGALAYDLLVQRHRIDPDWEGYIIEDEAAKEPRGIYLIGEDGYDYLVFEIE
jgi:hypothetical protein